MTVGKGEKVSIHTGSSTISTRYMGGKGGSVEKTEGEGETRNGAVYKTTDSLLSFPLSLLLDN